MSTRGSRAQQRLHKPERSYAVSRHNTRTHGIFAAVPLPHEDGEAYASLLSALADEYNPEGPTESFLVEQLGSIMWRTQRVMLAERAAFDRGARRALIGQQAAAKASVAGPDIDPDVTGRGVGLASKYEAHLSRRFVESLGALLRLQESRKKLCVLGQPENAL